MATHGLEIVDLSCARGDRVLFHGLALRVGGGELLYIAGSNGSGKTTLLRTICGLSRPADGEIRWRAKPVRVLGDDYRRDLAYVGHHDGVQGELTLTENLRAHQCLSSTNTSDSDAADRALDRLGLSAYRSFPAKTLSQGQRRRLALARLLLVDKPLWILDEPFTALDTRSCRLVAEILGQHLARGGMAVISSHQDFSVPGTTHRRFDLDGLRARTPYASVESDAAQHAAATQRSA